MAYSQLDMMAHKIQASYLLLLVDLIQEQPTALK